jgi:phospholipase/lecithinase/hemolysin
MRIKNGILALFFCISLGSGQVWATSFSSLYVFGDSLSDIGSSPSAVLSVYTLLLGNCDPNYPCPPYYNGRFSNGPVTAEYVANDLLPGGGNSSNFHDYAVGGSTTGIGNVGDGGSATSLGTLGLPGMAEQVQLYLSGVTGSGDSNSLYMVWGGGNDIDNGGSPTTAAKNIATYVDELALDGAKYIVVPNLPNLGLTPEAQALGSTAAAALTQATLTFNQSLASQLSVLSSEFPKTDIVDFNTYSWFSNLIQNAAAYGFTNTTDACVSASFQVCNNPNGYIFWDGVHPTTQADALLGAAIANAMVPIPTSVLLFATGLCGLFFTRKR